VNVLTRASLRVRLISWLSMRILILPFLFWTFYSSPLQARTAQPGDPVINNPQTGDVLQGVVDVDGSSNIDGFISAEISFAFSDDPTGTWFLLAINNQPVSNNRLGSWDTTVITDGNYILRMRISLADGTAKEVLVSDLRVRNYTPVETETPPPITPEATIIPTRAATVTSYPTPTVLARNPATLTPLEVSASVVYGGSAAILMFIIIGIYLRLRRK
jgi:hypothetical protein